MTIPAMTRLFLLHRRERVIASGGQVARLHPFAGREAGPLRAWPGGICLSRTIGDLDAGEYIVPVPHVKQIRVSRPFVKITPNSCMISGAYLNYL